MPGFFKVFLCQITGTFIQILVTKILKCVKTDHNDQCTWDSKKQQNIWVWPNGCITYGCFNVELIVSPQQCVWFSGYGCVVQWLRVYGSVVTGVWFSGYGCVVQWLWVYGSVVKAHSTYAGSLGSIPGSGSEKGSRPHYQTG